MALVLSSHQEDVADDPRNIAPTVGTAAPSEGRPDSSLFMTVRYCARESTPLALHTVTSTRPRRCRHRRSPLSFQVGLNNHLELFFNVEPIAASALNSHTLSGFYLAQHPLARQRWL